MFTPSVSKALSSQFRIQFRFVFLDLLQQAKFLLDLELFHRTDSRLLLPPALVRYASVGQQQVTFVQQAL